jgi:hypothetical protein
MMQLMSQTGWVGKLTSCPLPVANLNGEITLNLGEGQLRDIFLEQVNHLNVLR